jgi:hypothetical protein
MANKGDGGKTNPPFNQANINHPISIEELSEELKQQVEAKFNAVLKAFLESCTKDRREKVTQYKEPDFGEIIASTSSAAPKVKVNNEVPNPYLSHINYAKMLQDHKTVNDNNVMTAVNMIMSRFDRLEGKTTDYVDLSAKDSTSKQPEFDMPYNYYDNQGFYAAANKAKLTSSVPETDKTNLAGVGMSLQLVTVGQNSGQHTNRSRISSESSFGGVQHGAS